jgi:hypothetical protein
LDEPTPEVKETSAEEESKTPEPAQDEQTVTQVQVENEEKAAEFQEENKAIVPVDEAKQVTALTITITATEDVSAPSDDLLPPPTPMEDMQLSPLPPQRARRYTIPRVPRTKFAGKLVPGSILGKHSTDAPAPATKKNELDAVSPMDSLTFELAVLDLSLPHRWGLVKMDDEKFFGKEVPAETLGKRPAGYDDEDGEDESEEEGDKGKGKKAKLSHPVGVSMVRRRVYRVR